MKSRIESLYIDFFSHFLTIGKFAEYHNIDMDTAERIIRIGERISIRKF